MFSRYVSVETKDGKVVDIATSLVPNSEALRRIQQ
jgi:hypothetical protein